MRAFFITSAAALMVAGCGSEKSATFETEDGTGTYTVDNASGDVSMEFSGNDGETVSINSGANVSVDLPSGFTLYPGATVVSSTTVNQQDSRGSILMLTTSATPEQVVAHYRRQAEAAGVEIQMEMNTADSRMINGEGPGGLTFSVSANASGSDETSAQLMVVRDQGG